MTRPFQNLQPDLSSGDRIKDLKSKTLFKSAKTSFRKGSSRNNNYNNTIRFSRTGELQSINSHEERIHLNRGYALCADGVCNPTCADTSGNEIHKRGLLSCPKTDPRNAVKKNTNTNQFTTFSTSFLPTGSTSIASVDGSAYTVTWNAIATETNPLIFAHSDGSGVILDPSGDLLYPPCSTTISKFATIIRGKEDISGSEITTCHGGEKINLTWGNNTKQNYLAAYDPRNTKIKFNINPDNYNSKCKIPYRTTV